MSQGVRFHDMSGRERQAFENRTATGQVSSYGTQVNDSESDTRSLTSQLAFRHKGPKEGKEWKAKNAGKEVMSPDEDSAVRNAIKAVRESADAQYLLKLCQLSFN